MPDTVKRLDKTCPKCGTKMFLANGKEVCGECQLADVNKKAIKNVEEHYKENGDVLGNYNKARAEAKEKKSDYKSRQYKG